VSIDGCVAMVSIISILEVLGLIIAAVCTESSRNHAQTETPMHMQKCPLAPHASAPAQRLGSGISWARRDLACANRVHRAVLVLEMHWCCSACLAYAGADTYTTSRGCWPTCLLQALISSLTHVQVLVWGLNPVARWKYRHIPSAPPDLFFGHLMQVTLHARNCSVTLPVH